MAHLLIMTIAKGLTPMHPDEALTSVSNVLIETEDHDLFTKTYKMLQLGSSSKTRMKVVDRTASLISPTLVLSG